MNARLFLLLVAAFPLLAGIIHAAPDNPVTFEDENLERTIRRALDKAEGSITQADMATLEELDASRSYAISPARQIVSLVGLQYAVNLRLLNLKGHRVSDISLLSSLTALQVLILYQNPIESLLPLAALTSLLHLDLGFTGLHQLAVISAVLESNFLLQQLYLQNIVGPDYAALMPFLVALTALQILDLSHNDIVNVAPLAVLSGLHLYLAFNLITDISPIAGMALLGLNLEGNTGLINIAPIAAMTTLLYLNLSQTGVQDTSALMNLVNLQRLYIAYVSLSFIDYLAMIVSAATNLEELDVSGISVAGGNLPLLLGAISERSSLTYLKMSGLGLTSIAFLSALLNLTVLDISSNEITDLSPLQNLILLKYLWISYNPIATLAPLQFLTALQYLYMFGVPIDSLSHLSGLTALRVLHMGLIAGVVDPSPLATLVNLKELWMPQMGLTSIDFVANMLNLRVLNLSLNAIANISVLQNLIYLRELNLSGNPLASIAVLAYLTQLQYLFLSNCGIYDISPLAGLSLLVQLHLNNNFISYLGPIALLYNLRYLDLANNQIRSIAPLVTLALLLQLNLAGNFLNFTPDSVDYNDRETFLTNNPELTSLNDSNQALTDLRAIPFAIFPDILYFEDAPGGAWYYSLRFGWIFSDHISYWIYSLMFGYMFAYVEGGGAAWFYHQLLSAYLFMTYFSIQQDWSFVYHQPYGSSSLAAGWMGTSASHWPWVWAYFLASWLDLSTQYAAVVRPIPSDLGGF